LLQCDSLSSRRRRQRYLDQPWSILPRSPFLFMKPGGRMKI
jgi:hypothetical protein